MQGAGAVWSVPPLSPTQGKQLLSGWVVIEITRKASEFFEAILLERHSKYQAAKDPFCHSLGNPTWRPLVVGTRVLSGLTTAWLA